MKFKRLDISGFKSFFDKTTFFIEDGLTGIGVQMVVANQILLKHLDGAWVKPLQRV